MAVRVQCRTDYCVGLHCTRSACRNPGNKLEFDQFYPPGFEPDLLGER